MSETPPDQRTPSIEWAIWFQWLLATTLGWGLGWALSAEAAVGAVIGIGQWLVLRRLVNEAGWWIWASTVGWVAGWAIIVSGVIIPPETSLVASLIAGAVIGASLGLAQWLVLRRFVAEAGWWIPVNVAGWSVAFTGLLGSTVTGTVVGAVTGFALDWLLRQPRQDKPG